MLGGRLKTKLQMPLLAGLMGAAAIGGIASPLAKIALVAIPPYAYSFSRLLVGAFFMYAAMLFARIRPTRKSFRLFAPVATLWWLNALVFTLGLQKTGATTAQFIHIAVPVVTAMVAFFLIKERLNYRQWLGSVIALVGVAVVVLSNGSLSFTDTSLVGNMLIFASAIIFAFYAVLTKKEKYSTMKPVEMLFIASVCGMIVIAIPAIIEYIYRPWTGAVTPSVGWSLVGATFSISFFYLGFQTLIHRYGPSIATTNLYLLPVFVMVWAFILLHERITLVVGVGAVLALLGVGVFSMATRQKGNIPIEPTE